MTTKYATEQEQFWAGEFGDAYIGRNQADLLLASNINLFSKALSATQNISSCLEFGANIGLNLRALVALYPQMQRHAIEINAQAVAELTKAIGAENISHCSIHDYAPQRQFDLVLIKGVLIHINPESLSSVYDKLHASTGRYILVCEYYNPTPVSIDYRGHKDRLFKRDFAGEMLDRFPDLVLRDYGFIYRRDPKFPQDDGTWFLLERLPA